MVLQFPCCITIGAITWWEKGIRQICIYQWTVHGKVEFPKFPPDLRLGEGGPFHKFLPYTQKCILKIFQTWGVSIPQLLTLHSEMNFKIFPILGDPFHNFSSWIEKWKIYIDIFYWVSCNIKHITTISNLHFSIENIVH